MKTESKFITQIQTMGYVLKNGKNVQDVNGFAKYFIYLTGKLLVIFRMINVGYELITVSVSGFVNVKSNA
jgi:hypothetical protein